MISNDPDKDEEEDLQNQNRFRLDDPFGGFEEPLLDDLEEEFQQPLPHESEWISFNEIDQETQSELEHATGVETCDHKSKEVIPLQKGGGFNIGMVGLQGTNTDVVIVCPECSDKWTV